MDVDHMCCGWLRRGGGRLVEGARPSAPIRTRHPCSSSADSSGSPAGWTNDYARPSRPQAWGGGDFDVLAALRRSGEPHALSAGELSRTVLVTTGAISKRVDRLEARGLVGRSVAESDSRGRLVTLTVEGVELTDELIAVHLDNRRRLLSGLSADEQTQLADLLERLASTLPEGDG
ncbi:MarR family winged helix-turn-helix transcriptional regulator [Streptomyces sp. NPDC088180]|uniref:MarR family winged helix-turn-helix transcriptional regulator n=1 Tax=Streptomyces sp. NPDC088180 TaxID=3365837 RepID=UPI0037FE5D7D